MGSVRSRLSICLRTVAVIINIFSIADNLNLTGDMINDMKDWNKWQKLIYLFQRLGLDIIQEPSEERLQENLGAISNIVTRGLFWNISGGPPAIQTFYHNSSWPGDRHESSVDIKGKIECLPIYQIIGTPGVIINNISTHLKENNNGLSPFLD